MNPSRRLILPPSGFPHWLPIGDPPGGLLYLAWGRRHYGIHPIRPTKHEGWIYAVVLSGSPRLISGTSPKMLNSNDIALIGPDSLAGWNDSGAARSNILVWVWRDAPTTEHFASPKTIWSEKSDTETLKTLVQLHAATRKEIERPDAFSDQMLSGIRLQLEAAFLRIRRGRSVEPGAGEARIRLATAWMIRHFELRDPLRRLSDYLGVSPVTLQRWYRQHTGRTPQAAFTELKMTEAADRLRQLHASVKQVAYELGYRHVGDFSRAFRRRYGYPPSQILENRKSA